MDHDNRRQASRLRGALARLVYRLPIWLYRLNLGRLLGDRFLLLTHVGRRSGRLRQTVLEVIGRDRAADVYLIASGFGERSDWLRNVAHNPHVLLESAGRRREAWAERLSTAEAADHYRDYARRHPHAMRLVARSLTGAPFTSHDDAARRMAARVPLLALRPRPPFRPDAASSGSV